MVTVSVGVCSAALERRAGIMKQAKIKIELALLRSCALLPNSSLFSLQHADYYRRLDRLLALSCLLLPSSSVSPLFLSALWSALELKLKSSLPALVQISAPISGIQYFEATTTASRRTQMTSSRSSSALELQAWGCSC